MSSSIKTCNGSLCQVFIRVYRLEILVVFSNQLCELLTLPPFLWLNSPPHLPCVNKYTVYTFTMCRGEEVWDSGPQTDKHLPQSPVTGQLF
jgi:hypothetical protein